MGLTRPRAEQIYNLDYKQATRVVTVANITLSGGAPAVVDGVNLLINDRVLVTGQVTASQNGIYDVISVGTGSNGTWTRTSDANATGEIEAGMIIMVTEGAIYADTQWKLITDNPIVIDTTGLVFTQNYMANSISSGSSNVVVYSNAAVTISSGGTPNVVVISTTGQQVTGQISATGNISGNYFIGNGSQLTGVATSYNDANVTSLLSSFGSNTISTTGTVTTGNLLVNGSADIVGNLKVQGNITYVNSNVIVTNDLYIALSNNQSTYAGIDGAGFQVGNSGSGTLTNWTYSTAANAWTTNVSVSVAGNVAGNYVLGNGSQLTGITTSYNNANVTSLLASFGSNSISTTGNITSGYLFGNGSQLTGITTTYGDSNVITLLAAFGSNSISTTGNVTAKNLNSSNADLAEMYVADANYVAGTVVEFGGDYEITATHSNHSVAVAGIISTNPSYLMNSLQAGEHVLPVALTGRVPCRVIGPIAKGDRLVASDQPGTAQRLDNTQYQPGCIIGKSLENYDSQDPGIIEVAVGRN